MSTCTWVRFYGKDMELKDVDTTCGAYIEDEVLRLAESDFSNCPYCGGFLELETRAEKR